MFQILCNSVVARVGFGSQQMAEKVINDELEPAFPNKRFVVYPMN